MSSLIAIHSLFDFMPQMRAHSFTGFVPNIEEVVHAIQVSKDINLFFHWFAQPVPQILTLETKQTNKNLKIS